jgi:hypothetical protein
VHIVEVCRCCPGRCGVRSLSYAGGIGYHYGLVSTGERRLWKIYTIMAEVIKKVINDHGLGCWWGYGCGFRYLRSRWTPSVGVSVSSVLHAVCVEGLAH